MQAQSINLFVAAYSGDMRTGRPSNAPRSEFGARLKALRESAGLSQKQVAEQLGILQGTYALWERRDVALRADQMAKLSEILGTTTDELVVGAARRLARGGPTGKARSVFEKVSKLPRSRQQRILATVEDMLTAAHRVAV